MERLIVNVCVAGGKLSSSDYGNLWKLDGPLEVCEEPTLTSEESCGDEVFQFKPQKKNTKTILIEVRNGNYSM